MLAQWPVPDSSCVLWFEQSKAARERGKERCKKDVSGGMCMRERR